MASHSINLKELERKAFRSTYQDGLWDIYQGGLIASFTVFAGGFDSTDGLSSLQRMVIFLIGIGLSYLVFWGGKKFVTIPRIGQVTFGPIRQRRKRTLAYALGIIVAIQVVMVAVTVLFWQIPALQSWTENANMQQSIDTLIVAFVGALFVGPSLALIAYFNDFPRGYYIAAVMAASVFGLIWFSNAYLILLGGGLIILPGIYLFIRFLIEHPLPPTEIRNA